MTGDSDDFWETVELIDYNSSRANRDEMDKILSKYVESCKFQLEIVQKMLDDPNLDLAAFKKRAFRQRIDGTFEVPLRYGRQKILIRGQSGVQAKDLVDLKRIYRGLIERARLRDELLVSALIDAYGRLGRRNGSSVKPSQAA